MKSKDLLNPLSYKLLEHYKITKILAKCEVVEEHVSGIEYTEEEKKKLKSELMGRLGVKSEAKLLEKLAEEKVNEEDYYESTKKTIGLRNLAIKLFKDKAKAKFLDEKHKYDVGSYSLIRVKNVYQAREIIIRIQEGEESFEDLATKYSEGPEKYNRGVVGPGPIEKASPELAKIVRGSQPGVTRGPFQIGEWVVIVRLNHLTLAKYDSRIEEKICTDLFEKYIDEKTEKLMEELKVIFLNQQPKN